MDHRRSGHMLPVVVVAIMLAAGLLALLRVVAAWSVSGWDGTSSKPREAAPISIASTPASTTADAGRPDVHPVAMPSEASLENLLLRYRDAVRSGSDTSLGACYDFDRMVDAILQLGAIKPLSMSERAGFAGTLERSLFEAMHGERTGEWHRVELRRIEDLPDPAERLVYLRTWRPDGPAMNARWWVTAREGTWRIYDTEDLDLGLPMSGLLALAAVAATDAVPADWLRSLEELNQARQLIALDRGADAIPLLEALEPASFPAVFERTRLTFLAVAHISVDDPEAASRNTAAARALGDPTPLLEYVETIALIALERYGEALDAAGRYAAVIGPTADAQLQIGRAHRGLGEIDRAVSALFNGLADHRDSVSLIVELAITLPDGRLHELAGVIDRMTDRRRTFNTLAATMMAGGLVEPFEVLIDELRRLDPAGIDADLYEAELQLRLGRADEAATLLRRALDAASPERRVEVRERLVVALLSDDRPLEAYLALSNPKDGLPFVIERLARVADGPGIRSVVERHASTFPDDPRVYLYRGRAHEVEGRHDKAGEIYVDALRSVSDPLVADTLRRAAIAALYEAGELVKAYRSVTPTDETAHRIALHAARARDRRQLALIDRLHGPRASDDETWARWKVELAWLDGDMLEVKRLLDAGERGLLTHRALRLWYHDRLVRCLIRLDRLDDARRAAYAATRELGDPLYELLVAAAAERLPEAMRAAETLMQRGLIADALYEDEDCWRTLQFAKSFEPFRQHFPRLNSASKPPPLSERVWVEP